MPQSTLGNDLFSQLAMTVTPNVIMNWVTHVRHVVDENVRFCSEALEQIFQSIDSRDLPTVICATRGPQKQMTSPFLESG